MIPADCFDADTGWWIPTDLFGPMPSSDVKRLDRPCDGCRGRTSYEGGGFVCPARCIDGRHTFDIEVAGGVACGICGLSHGSSLAMPDGNHPWTPYRVYRVSIVPGMVLPILAKDIRGEAPERYIYVLADGRAWLAEGDVETPVTLPPAAAPGKYAVKVKVHS